MSNNVKDKQASLLQNNLDNTKSSSTIQNHRLQSFSIIGIGSQEHSVKYRETEFFYNMPSWLSE